MSIASILLLIVVQLRGGIAKVPRPIPWTTIALMGLTGTCLYYIGFNLSLFYTTASTGSIIQSFIPIVTALLAFIFLKESLSPKRFFGIGISTVGVLLIIILAAPGEKARNPFLGNMLMLSTVFFWSIYTLLAKRLANMDPIVVTAYSIAFGTLLLIPATFFEMSGKSFPAITTTSWLGAIYLGAISSAACLLLLQPIAKTPRRKPDCKLSYFIAGYRCCDSALFLGESLTVCQVGGGVLVLAGVFISLQK